MILLLRKKRLSRAGALKVLNHAMSDKYGAPVCSRFVEQLGLKSLFPCFMKTPSKIHKKGYIEVCPFFFFLVLSTALAHTHLSLTSRANLRSTSCR